MAEAFFFYLFAFFSIASALVVVTNRKPSYAVLSLVFTMFCLAVLFVLLGAYLIAAIHLLVYAGAILVLFLFVVMLLGIGQEESPLAGLPWFKVAGGIAVAIFIGEVAIVTRSFAVQGNVIQAGPGTIEAVGRLLFTQYLLPFEVTSIMLLVGIIAAVVLAKKEKA